MVGLGSNLLHTTSVFMVGIGSDSDVPAFNHFHLKNGKIETFCNRVVVRGIANRTNGYG